MRIEFTIPIEPVGQMRARHAAFKMKDGNVRSRTYKAADQGRHEEQIMQLLLPYRPETPIVDPIRLYVEMTFPIPASWPAWKREAALRGYVKHTAKPDKDNCEKHLLDCMETLGFFTNDSHIYRGWSVKKYGENPGWHVILETINEPKSAKEWGAFLKQHEDTLETLRGTE